MRHSRPVLGFLALVWVSSASFAQTSDSGRPIESAPAGVVASPDYGVSSTSIYNIAADDMMARLGQWSNHQLFNNGEVLPLDVGTLDVSGPMHLPSGVILESAEIFYFDNAPSNNPAGFFAVASTTGAIDSLGTIPFPNTSAGDVSVEFLFPPNTVVDNEANHYSINLTLQDNDGTHHRFRRARIHYRRQVSPAPAFATFGDVPTDHPFHRFVEALVASGITAGCGGGQYCPDLAVTRGQMAVFLSIALGLHFPN